MAIYIINISDLSNIDGGTCTLKHTYNYRMLKWNRSFPHLKGLIKIYK